MTGRPGLPRTEIYKNKKTGCRIRAIRRYFTDRYDLYDLHTGLCITDQEGESFRKEWDLIDNAEWGYDRQTRDTPVVPDVGK